MIRFLLAFTLLFSQAHPSPSREGDPSTIVENVNVIFGNYTKQEIDLIVPGVDLLTFSRYYDSHLGQWNFNPHCFLWVLKAEQSKTYTAADGTFEELQVVIGTELGNPVTYSGWQNMTNPGIRSTFKLKNASIANTARKDISAWTNQKNNQLTFLHGQYELATSVGGKKVYIPSTSQHSLYLLTSEILPNGNKIFYTYDKDLLTEIKLTNASEEKVLGWIQVQYGDHIHVESNNGQSATYHFADAFLSEVTFSHKQPIRYSYSPLLIEDGSTKIEYYMDGKVSAVNSLRYIYENGFTQVDDQGGGKTVYRFDDLHQLTAIEEYLAGSLYRVHKNTWGKKKDAGNLLEASLEDSSGTVRYKKSFSYDETCNVTKIEEWGNLTGAAPDKLESHTQRYTYQTSKEYDIASQKDAKGTGIQSYYKKGTNVLIKKLLFEKKDVKQRWFCSYNEDGALIQILTDDGDNEDVESYDEFSERHITTITPTTSGLPEIIEERYYDAKSKKSVLLKKVVNHFDLNGNVIASDIHDANEELRYTIKKTYEHGLLTSETDIAGNPTDYAYDDQFNLISCSTPTSSIKYQYNSQNQLVAKTDQLGAGTTYTYDELGRLSAMNTPSGEWLYSHDLFDSLASVKNPLGEVTQYSNTVRGSPVQILYADGTQELFKYDPEDSLHRHQGKNEIIRVFEYDFLGRISHIEYYERNNKGRHDGFKREYFDYDTLHLTSHRDSEEHTTKYTYDQAGKLSALSKNDQKKEFRYDALGRLYTTKKWKSAKTFTLEVQERDVLGQIVETRVEDETGKILLQNKYSYRHAQGERLSAIEDALGAVTSISTRNNLRTITHPDGLKTEDTLDPTGNVIRRIQNHRTTNYSFDALGRLTAAIIGDFRVNRSYAAGHLVQDERGKFEYNSQGDLSSFTPNGCDPIAFTYNEKSYLSQIAYADTAHTLSYDTKGNLTEIKSPEHSITYEMTPNDQLSRVAVKDKFGSYQVKLSYDGEGCIKEIYLPDGTCIKYTYEGPLVKTVSRYSKKQQEIYNYRVVSRDQIGHILEEVLPQHAGARTQTWDKSGRKTSISTDFFVDAVQNFDLSHNITKRNSLEYAYNAHQELISEPLHTYTYNSLGNRLTKNNVSYEIDPQNRLLKAGDDIFTHDAAGNLTTKTSPNGAWKFHTNPLGHITSIETPTQTIFFTYDLVGRRLSKKTDKTVRYFYLGNTELGALDEKGNIIELKVPSDPNHPTTSPAIAIELSGDYYIPVYDIVGNIACLIDPQEREIVESYTYSAFGEEKAPSNLINPWRYKSKHTDSETGLVYFGKRYYDPKIGRFITPDPMGAIDGLNFYRFCHNNPLSFTDHLGLAAEDNGNGYFYGEIEPHCVCEVHRDCKRGGDIRNAVGGASLGVSGFFMSAIQHFAEIGFLAAADDFGFDRALKVEMREAMNYSMQELHNMWNEGLVAAIDFDPQSEQANRYENRTYVGLIALDMLRGNMGDIRKGIAFLKYLKNPHLPVDLTSTLKRIQKGIKFPHRNDGAIFKNREGLLPKKHASYYREYVHPTPGVEGPGPRRVIIGENSDAFYSPDHYQTFIKIE